MKKLAIAITIAITASALTFGQTRKTQDIALVYPVGYPKFTSQVRVAVMRAVRNNKHITVEDIRQKDATVRLLKEYDRIVLILAPGDLKTVHIARLVSMGRKIMDKMFIWTIDRKASSKVKPNMNVDEITSATAKFVASPIVKSRIIPFILGK